MTDQNLDNAGTGNGKRPTFLTVLCILTFIGSGLGVIGGLLGLIGSSALGMFAPVGGILVQIIGLAAAGLCLFGAIQMWGLKKQGFMMYVLGSVLSIVGSIVSAVTFSSAIAAVSTSFEGMEGMESYTNVANSAAESTLTAGLWMGVAFGIVINVAFILMYNANKKHLVN